MWNMYTTREKLINTKVFVISHKQGLDDKFDRTITVEKVKNYSILTETVNEVTHGLVG